MVGISQPRVSQLIAEGALDRDGTALDWLRAYCERLRDQAAGRGQELTAERAALVRAQRIGQDIRNARMHRDYAPVGLLAATLAAASGAVSAHMEALRAELVERCPDLPAEALEVVAAMLADARAEWLRSTAELSMRTALDMAADAVDEFDLVDDDEP